jgi:hypothetical protein
MAIGSKKYREMQRRLLELRRHLLHFLPAPPTSRTSYSDQELDLARSYVVLAHAEIEAYCETLASEKARVAVTRFRSSGKTTPALRRMVSYYVGKNRKCWTGVTNPSATVVDAAYQSFSDNVARNHGVRPSNLRGLFYPLGITEPKIDNTWLLQMDSFGEARGKWAHNSVKMVIAPDPPGEATAVAQVLSGLAKLDRAVSRLR